MSTLPIYGEYFGLTSQPFSVSPDPTFLYASPSHKEGLAQLTYGIQARRGFVVLTGEVGTGKTTLIRSLLQQLSNDHIRIAFIFTLIPNIRDLLRTVCEEFGLVAPKDAAKDLHDYLALINEFLLASYKANVGVAVILDEAQNLSREVLEGVRLLSNFETSEDKLLQVLLVGQPELDARLNEPELRQLKQRIALRWHLSPLNLAECEEYIARRLAVAGGRGVIFPVETIRAVYAYSGGIPRLINVICDNGMLTAYALDQRSIGVAVIKEVARDLNLSLAPQKPVPVTTATIPIKFPEALAADAEAKSPTPTLTAPIPPPRWVEESHAVAASGGSRPMREIQSVAKAPVEPATPTLTAPIPPPRWVEESHAVAASGGSRPMSEMPSAANAASEVAPPAMAAPIRPSPRVEENHAVGAAAERQSISEMQSAASAASEPAQSAVVAPISPPPVDENAAAAVEPAPRPMPHIQSAARAALEAAQQRAAEIQEAQVKADERVERPFPKPTLAPKIVVAAKPESAAKAVGEPEPVPVSVANEPQTKIIETEIKKPEAIIITPKTNQPEEKTIELNVFKVDKVPPECIYRMIAALTDAMGPMASLVVRDHVDAMGESTENFPKRRFHELVYSTSGEILSEPLKARYENVMSEEVRALGAFEE
jgi:general secretion pathway protein A